MIKSIPYVLLYMFIYNCPYRIIDSSYGCHMLYILYYMHLALFHTNLSMGCILVKKKIKITMNKNTIFIIMNIYL